MNTAHRISTIERTYPDEWVLIEVTRVDRADQPLSGRVLAHSPDQTEITHETIRAREQDPQLDLLAFYTGDPIPAHMTVILGFVLAGLAVGASSWQHARNDNRVALMIEYEADPDVTYPKSPLCAQTSQVSDIALGGERQAIDRLFDASALARW